MVTLAEVEYRHGSVRSPLLDEEHFLQDRANKNDLIALVVREVV